MKCLFGYAYPTDSKEFTLKLRCANYPHAAKQIVDYIRCSTFDELYEDAKNLEIDLEDEAECGFMINLVEETLDLCMLDRDPLCIPLDDIWQYRYCVEDRLLDYIYA